MITTLQQARRLIKIVVGLTLLGAGVAMLVLPGPGILVVAIAVALLDGEFVWARRLRERLHESARRARDAVTRHRRT